MSADKDGDHPKLSVELREYGVFYFWLPGGYNGFLDQEVTYVCRCFLVWRLFNA
jgi:hypothetical protein